MTLITVAATVSIIALIGLLVLVLRQHIRIQELQRSEGSFRLQVERLQSDLNRARATTIMALRPTQPSKL